jgi:hypothetical protein
MGDAAGHPVRYLDPPLEEHLGSLSGKGTAKSMVDYLGRIYGCIREGRTSIVSSDVEAVTGHPPRSFAAFVDESKTDWRRAP